MTDVRSKTEPNKSQIQSILSEYSTHIQEVEKYIQSSFKDVEFLTNLQKEEEEKIKDLHTIRINSLNFPLDLNLDHYFQLFYDSGVLKSFESRIVQENFPIFFFSKRVKKMCKLLFLIVFILKFPECVEHLNTSLLSLIRKKFSKAYVKVFAKLPKMKDELINLLIFSICYIAHMLFYMLFPRNQSQFKIRFILDVYHIAIFELNGIYVSDYYLQQSFERFFTSKFLDYEQEKNKNPVHKKNQSQIITKNDKNFLGRKMTYPVIFNHEGGVDFADELINRLKIHKRSPRRHGVARLNSNNNIGDQNINNFEDAVNLADQKLFQDEAKKINEKLVGKIFLTAEEKEKEDTKKKIIVNMNSKKKFNCIQISPSFSQVLDISNMNLPFKKKKLINHSVDKLYTQNKDYKEMFEEINYRRKIVKETKVKSRPKSIIQKSLLNKYGQMKIEYDEKAKKYPKLFCDMEELYEVLNKHDERFTNLASSKRTLNNYNKRNVLKFEEIKKEAEEEMKKRENDQENRLVLNEKEKLKLFEQLEKYEIEEKEEKEDKEDKNKFKKKETNKFLETDKNDEIPISKEPSKNLIMTLFKLPMLANKFLQNTAVGKKNLSKSRLKNLSESTAASLLKNEEDKEEQIIDYSSLRKKVNLNAVIEERGHLKNVSDSDVEEKTMKTSGNEKFVDKRSEYHKKYSKIIKGNHDENIDEIITKIMVKQNRLTNKLMSGFKSTKNNSGVIKNGRIKLNL